MDSYLENAMDYVQSTFENANEWLKAHDPLPLTVFFAEASVWDALDNDRGNDRNEGRDYVRTSISGSTDSDYKRGGYSRDQGEDHAHNNHDVNAGSNSHSKGSSVEKVKTNIKNENALKAIDPNKLKGVSDKTIVAFTKTVAHSPIDLSDKLDKVLDSFKRIEKATVLEVEDFEDCTDCIVYGACDNIEIKMQKDAQLQKAEDELRELKEKHLKILDDASKSSNEKAEVRNKAAQDVAEAIITRGTESVGAGVGFVAGGALGGPLGAAFGAVGGGMAGEKVAEYSIKKAKEVFDEREKEKEEL
jgi:hypothetical protein